MIKYDDQKAIFVLYTPLHVMIAERILENKGINCFSIIYVANKNNVNKKYFARIACRAEKAIHISNDPAGLKALFYILYLCYLHKRDCYYDLYCSNVKKIHSRFVFGVLRPRRFFSLDDGSGNISGGGYFYELKEPFAKYSLLKILFPFQKLSYADLVLRLNTHYTIYAQLNVYGSVSEKIELIEINDKANKRSKTKCIYLGNAFSEDGECTEGHEKAIYQYACKLFEIDYYLPHPREKRDKSKRIAGNKLFNYDIAIAEEVVINEIKKGYNLIVIGVYSTVLLNVAAISSVSCVNIKSDIKKPTKNLDNIFTALNIRQIEMKSNNIMK